MATENNDNNVIPPQDPNLRKSKANDKETIEQENLNQLIVFVRCTLTKDERTNSTFDARNKFGLLLAALKNADTKLRLCPFDENSELNAIEAMHNLPDDDELKSYFANVRITKYHSAITTIRIETTLRINQLRAAPAVKAYLEKHQMSFRQQQLRSSVVAKAGWFLHVHPTLTYREHFKKRLYHAFMPNDDVPDFELRQQTFEMPAHMKQNSQQIVQTKALVMLAAPKDVAKLQTLLISLPPFENAKFIPATTTMPPGQLIQAFKLQNLFLSSVTYIPVPTLQDINVQVEIGTQKESPRTWLLKQPEFTRANGLYAIDSGAVFNSTVYAIAEHRNRTTAKTTLHTLLERLRGTTNDATQQSIFAPPPVTTPAQQASNKYIEQLATYFTTLTGNPQEEDTTTASITPPTVTRKPRITYAKAASNATEITDDLTASTGTTPNLENKQQTTNPSDSSQPKNNQHDISAISSLTETTNKNLTSLEQKLALLERRESTVKTRMDALNKDLLQTQKLTHKAIDKMTGIQDDVIHLSTTMEKQLGIIQRSFESFRQFQSDQLEERLEDFKDEITQIIAEQLSSPGKNPSTKRNRRSEQSPNDFTLHPDSPSQPPQQKRLQTQRNPKTTRAHDTASTTSSLTQPPASPNRYLQLSLTDEDSDDSDSEPQLPPIEEDTEMKPTSPGGRHE